MSLDESLRSMLSAEHMLYTLLKRTYTSVQMAAESNKLVMDHLR